MWGLQEVAGGAAWGAFEGGEVEISDGDEEAGVGGVAEVTGKYQKRRRRSNRQLHEDHRQVVEDHGVHFPGEP
jgi:hypothetical protein